MQTMLRAGCAVIAMAAPAALWAQAVPQDAQSSAQAQTDVGFGDIIVTATRRAQLISDIPIAVTAIGQEQILNSGATDLRSLNQLAPSLLVSGATSEVNFTARVRGVGTVGENPGLESSVALFIDGVYRSRTGTGLSDLGEIERVEVLRGPQGTLFGRNASAGLISVTTVQPKYDTEFFGAITGGNYNNFRIEGGANVELVPGQLAARVEGLYHSRDGFVDDVLSDRTFNDRDRWLIRGQLRWDPTETLSVRLIGDYSSRDEQCCAASVQTPRDLIRDASGQVIQQPSTLAPILAALGAQIPYGEQFKTAVTRGFDYAADATDWGISAEVNWDLGFANLTSITAWRDYYNRQGQDSDFENLDILRRTNLERQFRTFSQEVRLQGVTLNDRLDWLVGGYFARETLETSDDLKFGVDAERYFDCVIANVLAPPLVNPTVPRCTNLPATAFPGYGGFAQLLGAAPLANTGVGDGNFFKQVSRNYAFFTHNVFDLVDDRLFLTVGARYTNERKELDAAFNFTNTLCGALRNSNFVSLAALPCAINGTAGPGIAANDPNRVRSEDEFTGTVSLSWKPTKDLLAYASWSRGYKAGGFNLDASALDIFCNPDVGTPANRAACAAQLALPANTVGNARGEAIDLQFSQEIVQSIEAGVKWARQDLSANLTFFRSDFKDFQLNTFNGVNFEVANVNGCRTDLNGADRDPSATTGACDPDDLTWGVRAQGIELDFAANPVADVTITSGILYASTRYNQNLVSTNGRPLSPVLFQLPGEQISNAPEFVVTGSATWNPEINSKGWRALVYLDYRLQGANNTGSDLDREKVQPDYIVVNGRVGLQGPGNRWSLELWALNLLNKEFFQIGADMPLHGSGTFNAVADGRIARSNALFVQFPGEPRTFGVTGRFRF